MIKNIYESRAKFFDESEDYFFLLDSDLTIADTNKSASKEFGANSLIGSKFTALFNVSDESLRETIKSVKEPSGVLLSAVCHNCAYALHIFRVENYFGVIVTEEESPSGSEAFIYKVAHDIRSPLASILGLTNIAESELEENPTGLKYVSMIRQQAERMDALLKKIIETTMINKGEPDVQLIDFPVIIEDVRKSLAYVPGFSAITFREELSAVKPFFSDKLLIISLFQNLIDNAIKYRKELNAASYVRIKVKDENNGVRIVIEDNGIGIEKKMQQEVFKLFFRGTEHASGTGLGLYTVKQCVKKLGGTIELVSDVNAGTTFSIWLPSRAV